MSVSWHAPVSLHKQPKGARMQAVEARLEQYKQWIMTSLPKSAEPAPFTTSASLSKPVPSPKPISKHAKAAAARRARRQSEMIGAAASLLRGSGPKGLASAAATLGLEVPEGTTSQAALLGAAPAKATDEEALNPDGQAAIDEKVVALTRQVSPPPASDAVTEPDIAGPIGISITGIDLEHGVSVSMGIDLELQRLRLQQLQQLSRMQQLSQQKPELPPTAAATAEMSPAEPSLQAQQLRLQLQCLQQQHLEPVQPLKPLKPMSTAALAVEEAVKPPHLSAHDALKHLQHLQLQQQQLQLQLQLQQQQLQLQLQEEASRRSQQAAAATLISLPSCTSLNCASS